MSDHPSDTNAREYGPGKAAVCDERCPITKHDCEHRPPYPEWGGCRTFREHNADTRLEAQATRPLPDDVKAAVRADRDHAVRLLTHYLDLAGVIKDSDNRVEVSEIVDYIIEAAIGNLRGRMMRDGMV